MSFPSVPFQSKESPSHIEAKMRQQQKDSEVDSKWLIQEENNLKKRLSLITSGTTSTEATDQQPNSLEITSSDSPRSQTPGSNTGSLRKTSASSMDRSVTPDGGKKTASMDRSQDKVYRATTLVVKAVMALTQGVDKANSLKYLELVRNVGEELRALLGTVDEMSHLFPSQAHK